MFIVSYLRRILYRKPKIIVILGQTASGKSDLAVEVAKKYEGEVVSADSRQVYRGLDIGSGKITQEEMQSIPHHLLDVADPQEVFSAHDFQKHGKEAIQKILAKGKLPIICGGTGFYIESLIYETNFSNIAMNKKLREKYEKLTLREIQELFQNKYPKEVEKVDMQNKVRIIRALEICKALGHIPKLKQKKTYEILFIGTLFEKEVLKERIKKRLLTRFDEGMIDEVKELHEYGVSYERLNSFGLEYRHIANFLQGKISKENMTEELYRDILHFAKRQMTWFKRNKNIHWFNPQTQKKEIMGLVHHFLK